MTGSYRGVNGCGLARFAIEGERGLMLAGISLAREMQHSTPDDANNPSRGSGGSWAAKCCDTWAQGVRGETEFWGESDGTDDVFECGG
jgi:hypothetical protein